MKKIAVITGASSGIGKEFIIRICKDKEYRFDEIWMIARRTEKMQALAEEFPQVKFKILSFDLSNPSSYKNYEELLEAENICIGLLINCAGFGKVGLFKDISLETQLQMIDVNIKALTAVSHISIKFMREGSQIINIASFAGFMPLPSFNVYSATKAYVINFSRALKRELSKQNIYVLTLCPGPVETEFSDVAGLTEYNDQTALDLPEKVVTKALRDIRKNKDLSIYGKLNNVFRVIVKLVPHSFFMRFMK